MKHVSVLLVIGVNSDGFHEIIGLAEGLREDRDPWSNFLRYLKERGLSGVKLAVSDKCPGLFEVIGDFVPDAKWQRCIVHWYRNAFSICPKRHVRELAAMLKAIHAQENREAALEKSKAVRQKLLELKLDKIANFIEASMEETLSYMYFPREHRTRLRTNNALERIMRKIRRQTRVVGCFPDGNSPLRLVGARLRHIASTPMGNSTIHGY